MGAVQVDELLPAFSLPQAAIRNECLDRLVRKPPTSLSLDIQQRNAGGIERFGAAGSE